ncbi:hypothetical protein HUW46_09372 [Amycolatopsis sp. CA-230715]|nr:hypothetical protein HUW46_09372 [Amycolatopsis sp. CA-230715]
MNHSERRPTSTQCIAAAADPVVVACGAPCRKSPRPTSRPGAAQARPGPRSQTDVTALGRPSSLADLVLAATHSERGPYTSRLHARQARLGATTGAILDLLLRKDLHLQDGVLHGTRSPRRVDDPVTHLLLTRALRPCPAAAFLTRTHVQVATAVWGRLTTDGYAQWRRSRSRAPRPEFTDSLVTEWVRWYITETTTTTVVPTEPHTTTAIIPADPLATGVTPGAIAVTIPAVQAVVLWRLLMTLRLDVRLVGLEPDLVSSLRCAAVPPDCAAVLATLDAILRSRTHPHASTPAGSQPAF